MKNKEQMVKLGLTEKQADEVMMLESEMLKRAVKFSYTKKDGSRREAEGTLDRSKMDLGDGTIWEPVGKGLPEKPEWVRYWDLKSMGWRQFSIFNLIAVEG